MCGHSGDSGVLPAAAKPGEETNNTLTDTLITNKQSSEDLKSIRVRYIQMFSLYLGPEVLNDYNSFYHLMCFFFLLETL